MKPLVAVIGTVLLLGLVVGLGAARQASSDANKPVEIAVLSDANWDIYVPNGKEVDAIYGDIVLRNAYLTMVIAKPVATRKANMTVQDVGGCLIDLTVRDNANDLLAAYYPGKQAFPYRSVGVKHATGREVSIDVPVSSHEAHAVVVKAEGSDTRPEAVVSYSLGPADRYLTVTTTFTNRSGQPQTVTLEDDFRADGKNEEMTRTPNGTVDRFWLDDRFWGQAYGLDATGHKLQLTSDERVTGIKYESQDGATQVQLEPGKSYELKRRLYPGSNLIDVHSLGANLSSSNASTVVLAVRDKRDSPISNALIEFKRNATAYGTARTNRRGEVTATLPDGEFTADLVVYGRKIASNASIPLKQQSTILKTDYDPANLSFEITDGGGHPIACKIELNPLDDAAALNFGPETADFAVKNLLYTADGRITKPMPPGKYAVIISHGPEFDSEAFQIELNPGGNHTFKKQIVRSVSTPGWVSGDFHSHSTPSGDNTTSQLGRVLNLVAEQIEFAPCTEHNRVSTYDPHIDRLKIRSQMATVSGIELTSEPLPLCHENAFPMKMTPHTQDNGAPIAGPDLESQIERLALHDNRSEKLIQVNHPDIGWMFFDKDGDGKPDGGFERAFPFMDVVEVHPIDLVLSLGPTWKYDGKTYHNTVFNWLQLLNQGFRIYGVVNTDAHYNFHGSGWLRNWIQTATDDPARIDPMQMVHAIERGRVVMSNGPYLEVTAFETGKTEPYVSGQDMKAIGSKVSLKVRVQCANWLDINSVFVLVNGRRHPIHDYSRDKNPDAFRGGVLKFERTLDLELKQDAHIIVVTGNTEGKLSAIYGAEKAKTQPAALSNPIFVDIDGNGFQANKDTLDHPLPVKNVTSR